mmetsp:Transcript_157500/g.277858  ORF Transcript_157500/g.277858 Transcript_157500/m.277858 type:complete len:216 (-) Transcript_157500:56-703(-)
MKVPSRWCSCFSDDSPVRQVTPVPSRACSPLEEALSQFDFSMQPCFLSLLAPDFPALRCVCRELRRTVDVRDLEMQKVVIRAYLKQVCTYSGAVYAVFWAVEKGCGVLHAICHYNPDERIEQVKRETGDDALYTTESYAFRFRPGQGLIGKAFVRRNEIFFFEDVTTLPEDIFLRRNIAQRFGIRSVVIMWYKGGVLEFGTVDKWSSFNWATCQH